MRKRVGRFLWSHESNWDKLTFIVYVPFVSDYSLYTAFIRENCRRGDWSKSYIRAFSQRQTAVYHFADEQDAMTFKLMFGI